MAIYKWKSGSRVSADAQKVGEVCERLEKKGNLTPKALVDASRRKNAALHDLFEWNDEIAAEKYRETQASYLIRSIEVVSTGTSEPIRAFVSVTVNEQATERTYINVKRALSTNGTREEVLAIALAELRAFERKYKNLEELASVLAAIREVA
jgi:hypothetical protein